MLAVAALAPAVALAADAGQSDAAPEPHAGEHALALRDRVDALRHSASQRAERDRKRRERKRAAAQKSTASPALQAIAACESGGDPHAIGGGGAYRGKYQFDQGTWASVGGSGDPAAAPEAEQDRRAAILYARSGASSWPVCGQ